MPPLTEEEKKASAFDKIMDAVEEFQKPDVPDLSVVVHWNNTVTIGGKEFVRIGKYSLIACDRIERIHIVKDKNDKNEYECLVILINGDQQRISIP